MHLTLDGFLCHLEATQPSSLDLHEHFEISDLGEKSCQEETPHLDMEGWPGSEVVLPCGPSLAWRLFGP